MKKLISTTLAIAMSIPMAFCQTEKKDSTELWISAQI
jgi:hypothetical protein